MLFGYLVLLIRLVGSHHSFLDDRPMDVSQRILILQAFFTLERDSGSALAVRHLDVLLPVFLIQSAAIVSLAGIGHDVSKIDRSTSHLFTSP